MTDRDKLNWILRQAHIRGYESEGKHLHEITIPIHIHTVHNSVEAAIEDMAQAEQWAQPSDPIAFAKTETAPTPTPTPEPDKEADFDTFLLYLFGLDDAFFEKIAAKYRPRLDALLTEAREEGRSEGIEAAAKVAAEIAEANPPGETITGTMGHYTALGIAEKIRALIAPGENKE